MRSQRAEKQASQKKAPQQNREFGHPQPDQARRGDQGRVDEEHGFGDDDEENDQ
jgi:hypothetical protein